MAATKTEVNLEEFIAQINDLVINAIANSNDSPGATRELAKAIDHTLLKLDATEEQIEALCAEARVYGFKTVCVRLKHVKQASNSLRGSEVGVCCVVGFHEGTYSSEEKLREAREAVERGASELDIVLNYPALKSRLYDDVYHELRSFRSLFPAQDSQLPLYLSEGASSDLTKNSFPLHTPFARGVNLKLILETSQLSEPEIIAAVTLAALARFDFVKTSTGFNGHGATVRHVQLMKHITRVADEAVMMKDGNSLSERSGGTSGADHTIMRCMSVKASGGIKTAEDAIAMLKAGASRLGTSSGVTLVQQASLSSDKVPGAVHEVSNEGHITSTADY